MKELRNELIAIGGFIALVFIVFIGTVVSTSKDRKRNHSYREDKKL